MEYNDSTIEDYIHLITNFFEQTYKETQHRPTIEEVMTLVTASLKSINSEWVDFDPSSVNEVKAKLSKQKLTVGNLIAIPLINNNYAFASYLGKNLFGYAYGIYQDLHSSIIPPHQLKPWKSLYSGNSYINEGKWIIINKHRPNEHDFDGPPPIYHDKKFFPDDDEIGPNGTFEFPNEQLKHATPHEVEVYGYYDKDFPHSTMEDSIEKYLITSRCTTPQQE